MPAVCTEKPSVEKRSMGRMPQAPSARPRQSAPAPKPSAVTAPMPVIATGARWAPAAGTSGIASGPRPDDRAGDDAREAARAEERSGGDHDEAADLGAGVAHEHDGDAARDRAEAEE